MSQFKPVEDNFFIGPQPTAADLEAAHKQGIKTVIDLRLPTETAASNRQLTQGHGLDYVNIPVGKDRLDERRIDEFEAALQSHERPFLLHCATGARSGDPAKGSATA